MVMRIHHCYADGIALVQVFLSLTDSSPQGDTLTTNPEKWKRSRAKESTIFQRLLEPAREGVDSFVHFMSRVIEEAVLLVNEPEKAGRYLTELGELVRELSHALTLPNDPKTLFKKKLGVRKRVAWAEPIPLEEVVAVSKALGCTVNDVLISAVTGALRSYMLEEGESLSASEEIRATVPVNLRPLEHARELGNHFGLVFLTLPISVANPLERLYCVHERMNELKASKQAAMAFGLLAALGMSPSAVQKPALDLLSEKASMVLTNVPGPAEPLYLAGGKVQDMMFWVPQSGKLGVGVSILSYDRKVFFGLIVDRRLIADPGRIIQKFKPELEKLMYLAMMLPQETRPCSLAAESYLVQALGALENRQTS